MKHCDKSMIFQKHDTLLLSTVRESGIFMQVTLNTLPRGYVDNNRYGNLSRYHRFYWGFDLNVGIKKQYMVGMVTFEPKF